MHEKKQRAIWLSAGLGMLALHLVSDCHQKCSSSGRSGRLSRAGSDPCLAVDSKLGSIALASLAFGSFGWFSFRHMRPPHDPWWPSGWSRWFEAMRQILHSESSSKKEALPEPGSEAWHELLEDMLQSARKHQASNLETEELAGKWQRNLPKVPIEPSPNSSPP